MKRNQKIEFLFIRLGDRLSMNQLREKSDEVIDNMCEAESLRVKQEADEERATCGGQSIFTKSDISA